MISPSSYFIGSEKTQRTQSQNKLPLFGNMFLVFRILLLSVRKVCEREKRSTDILTA